ncbi:MAG: hypothetical protein ACXU82_14675 [Caulobacteraceae bacterium]
MMQEIREIYRRWLDGDLSQEDALFAIGEVLGEVSSQDGGDSGAEDRPAPSPAFGQKGG